MSYQSGQTNASVSFLGGIGVATPSATQTVINIAGTGSGASQDAYTVPAGKTFYLFAVNIEETANEINIFKNDGATRVFNMRADAALVYTCQFSSAVPIWGYATGEIVKVTATNGKTYNFWGILE